MYILRGYDKEVRAILGAMTLKRLLNLFRLYGSHFCSVLFKRNMHSGHPAYVSLETTNSCNLSCPECVTGMNALKRPSRWMNGKESQLILEQLSPFALLVNLYFQGEPLLNPELLTIVEQANAYGLYSIISTNAQNLTEAKAEGLVRGGLKKIIVSLDGLTQETYSKYRVRGDLNKVLQGLNNLIVARKKNRSIFPIIEVQFIVFKHNEHEIIQARKRMYEMGCDRFVLKTAQFYSQERAKQWMPSRSKYRRYKSNQNLDIAHQARRGCKKMWSSIVVCSGGEVALCCMDKNADYALGNMYEQTYSSIWNGNSAELFRTRIANGTYLDICKNCPLKG